MLTLERNLLLGGLGRIDTTELCEIAAVLGVLMNTEFQALAECLIELCEVVLVLGDLVEEVHAFLDDVFANDLEGFVLLERLT
jgi:hypothetical protein